MKVGDKFVKDGEVVEVIATGMSMATDIIWYAKKGEKEHLLTKDDFLEQYKPLEVVYEYQYAFGHTVYLIDGAFLDKRYWTDEEAKTFKGTFQRLDFTKRERVQ